MNTRSLICTALIAASSAFAGGGYECRLPIQKFSGEYKILILHDNNAKDAEKLVRSTVSDVMKQRPQLFERATVLVQTAESEELRLKPRTLYSTYNANRDRTFVIGVGDPDDIKVIFESQEIDNGALVVGFLKPAVSAENIESVSVEKYRGEMMKHATYRALLQLNGEERHQLSTVTPQHAFGNQLK